MSQPATKNPLLLRIILLENALNLRQLLQLSFILAASTVFFLFSFPALRDRFIIYGSRAVPAHAEREADEAKGGRLDSGSSSHWYMKVLEDFARDPAQSAQRPSIWFNRCLYIVEKLRVPHNWFLHFYVVSVASSLFWGAKIARKDALVADFCQNVQPGGTMSINQIALLWSFMTVHGIRRLLESLTLGKSSSSSMWFVHWALGIWFYLAMSFAVWIEGAETLLQSESPLGDVTLSAPSVRTMLGVPLFILASGVQNDCHVYLASLPKYTLPNHPIFHTMICPHYTAECVLYLSLAIMGTPHGAWINYTILSAFAFVFVNLAVTASTTKEWYIKKFGKEKVEYRWIMIPYIF